MRISDWSSDVCSSDLAAGMQAGVDEEVVADAALQNKALQEGQPLRSEALVQRRGQIERILQAGIRRQGFQRLFPAVAPPVQQARQAEIFAGRRQIGRASCRERGCQYV